MFVNLLPYCPRDLQLGGIDGAGAAGHKLGGLLGRFILTQLCLLPPQLLLGSKLKFENFGLFWP